LRVGISPKRSLGTCLFPTSSSMGDDYLQVEFKPIIIVNSGKAK
jgi:hypothetical protein